MAIVNKARAEELNNKKRKKFPFIFSQELLILKSVTIYVCISVLVLKDKK